MLLQEPAESPYDIRFDLLGFPVRIAWSFWLGSAFFGYNLVEAMDRGYFIYIENRNSDLGLPWESPGRAQLLLMWAVCLLVSILIHELGHALAFRQNGIESRIVLYHFGGLAIPTSSYSQRRGFRETSEVSNLWISFAGPLAQFGSAVVVVVGLMSMSLYVPGLPGFLVGINDKFNGNYIESPLAIVLAVFYLWPSVMWSLLNLLPVWPLDGGQMTRSLFVMFGGNVEQSLWISMVVAVSLAFYAFQVTGSLFNTLFLLSFAFANYQELSGPRY